MFNNKNLILLLTSVFLTSFLIFSGMKIYKNEGDNVVANTTDAEDQSTQDSTQTNPLLENADNTKNTKNTKNAKNTKATSFKPRVAYTYKVRGKRYSALANSQGFTQVGTASWYGGQFHGRKTANGEIYNMNAMTAAHKTLPLRTYAKVTNLATNKSIVIKINDRGPFYGNRIIDLSRAAAQKLGVIKKGTAKVEVTAL